MGRPLIDARKAIRDLDLLWPVLERRMEALKRYIVQRVAEEMMDEVISRAPNSAPDLPAGYPDLEIAAVDDTEAPTYAVVYVGRPTRMGALDPETTILYPKRYDDNDVSKIGRAIGALSAFAPFTLGSLPASIPRDRGFFSYRTVRRDEVLAIAEKNAEDAEAIAEIVEESDLETTIDYDELAAYLDVVFQVLRREFGIAQEKNPHWRPSIRAVRQGETMSKVLGDPLLAKAALDPRFRGWTRLGMMGRKITYTELDPIEGFTKRILA